MHHRYLFALLPPLLASCSSPDPADLVSEPRDRIGVGLALIKDCDLVKPREYSAVFGWVATATDIFADGTFDRNIEQADALRTQYGCDSAEVNAIASLTSQAMAIDYQTSQPNAIPEPAQPTAVEPPADAAVAEDSVTAPAPAEPVAEPIAEAPALPQTPQPESAPASPESPESAGG